MSAWKCLGEQAVRSLFVTILRRKCILPSRRLHQYPHSIGGTSKSPASFSCDTFVALPDVTKGSSVIFGKNADRPNSEVQEVVHIPAQDHSQGSKLQCTYIEVDQVPHTNSVVLSKPAWMWGAEMGANEHEVCIGNEGVTTKLSDDKEDAKERLTGMDLVRLALERSFTAREAMDVITSHLKKYGQGGSMFEDPAIQGLYYLNTFLIADRTEAWVLETAGQFDVWAAERITSGVRNISNLLTIGTKIDEMSDGLKDLAVSCGFWNPGKGPFHFADSFHKSLPLEDMPVPEKMYPSNRYHQGYNLMKPYLGEKRFSIRDMFGILRNTDAGIAMVDNPMALRTMASQVSILPPHDSRMPDCHWFTATPDPHQSVFKPFMYTQNARITSRQTVSPTFGSLDPVKQAHRFQSMVDRRHALFRAHEKYHEQVATNHPSVERKKQLLLDLEEQLLADVDEFCNDPTADVEDMDVHFDKAAMEEIKIYES